MIAIKLPDGSVREYPDQTTSKAVAESIGIEGRGALYDAMGVLVDMVQSHMLQVLSFAAMEPPRPAAQ